MYEIAKISSLFLKRARQQDDAISGRFRGGESESLHVLQGKNFSSA